MSTGLMLRADRVSKRFYLRRHRTASLKERVLGMAHALEREERQEFWALRDLSLDIRAGESVALVGRNGSGKSTLLKIIAGIMVPCSGRLLVRRGARIGSMIELGVGFHPELSGRENIYLNASVAGLGRRDVDALYDRIVDYAEIGTFIDEPLKNYSSGMSMRLAFSVAVHLEPEVLLLDEVFAVGDAEFQAKCRRTMEGFLDTGRTLVFVSHSPEAIRTMCRRVCVLSHGHLLFDGDVDGGLDAYAQLLDQESRQAV